MLKDYRRNLKNVAVCNRFQFLFDYFSNSTTNNFEVNSIEKIDTAIIDEINHGDNEKWFWIGMLVGSVITLLVGFVIAPIVEYL